MTERLREILAGKPHRIILSNPARSGPDSLRKMVLSLRRGADAYQLEKYPGRGAGQVDKPVKMDEAARFLSALLAAEVVEYTQIESAGNELSGAFPVLFRQLEAWTDERYYLLRVSRKGKVSVTARVNRGKPGEDTEDTPHDRKKNYILPEGTVIPPLTDLGVFTPEGKVAASMGDKFRQINRFLEIVADVVPEPANGALSVVDYACGRSYLTFILYYYLTAVRGLKDVRMTGLDQKAHVIEECNAAARRYGYSGLRFVQGDLAGPEPAGYDRADLAVALHACDTASDYVLYRAVRGGARVILAAPCCQHELNAQMTADSLPILTRYGVVKERTAALMTDAIRANLLAYCGYRTQLMEFIDLSHTPKNLLIRAVKTDMPKPARETYRAEAEALCKMFGFRPALARLLGLSGL